MSTSSSACAPTSTAIAASATATAASASLTAQSYEVFINHRGVDVKKTFARSLYLGLLKRGVRAFLDEREKQPGYDFPSQIEHAIRTASVHVAIFSPHYAESYWCLHELQLMVESKSPIIPVFYRTTPAEVRWIKGNYAQALERLAKKRTHEGTPRYESKIIENCRHALSSVADNSGFELEVRNGEELEWDLLDNVVECLSKMLKKPDLYVSEYPTGLDDKMSDFENTVLLQQPQSGKPQIVGITGLGGVGKTTLARQFFNRKKSDYPNSCFLPDIKDGSLTLLQAKLLKDLARIDKPIYSVDEGKRMLIEHLKPSQSLTRSHNPVDGVVAGKEMPTKHLESSKALIVLDDVDHEDQVRAFLPLEALDFLAGSLILITSRDKDVLITARVAIPSIYMLIGLNTEYSRELFCSHAFKQAYPPQVFQDLTDSFVEYCNGLPLSLKVIGAHLYGKEISEWEDELGSLPTEGKGSLKISYDALNEEEQQIFLDIACFLSGQNRDTAINIWDASGWNGRRGFQNLQDRCLVEVDSSNLIHMHDHLRHLGREIGEKTSPFRLWRWTEDVIDYLSHQPSGQLMVRGFKMDRSDYNEYSYDVMGRIGTMRLRIIDIEYDVMERILGMVKSPYMKGILWLRWRKCPYSSLPSWVSGKNLRHLDVSGSDLNTLWQTENQLQAPLWLRELYVDAPLSEVPESIRRLTQLERIVLKNGYFKTLPNKFFYDMHSMKHITLQNCEQMMLLPDSVRMLTGLQILDLNGCSSLQRLPDLFGDSVNLQNINLNGCSSLQRLPDSFGGLVNLQNINLNGCSSLQRLPDLFGDLVNLQNINLNGCSSLQRLPYSVGKLCNLQSIDLRGCSNLQMIPNYFGNLEGLVRIDLSGCSGLHMLPNSFRNLKNLRHLDLSKCSNLEMLPYSFGNLRNLQYINLSKCSNLQMLPNSLENLKQLQYMNLSWCSNFQTLPNSFGNLRNLRHIDLSWCSNLQMLPNSFGNLTNLQHINLSGCSNLPILPNSFGNLIQLKHLYLGKCYELSISNETLGQIRTLEALEISGCYGIEVLPPQITNQQFLREMYLFCPLLRELPSAVGELSHLEILHLESSCLELLEMGELVSLEELQVRECVNLKSIQGLAQLTKLRRLDVANCSGLKELSGVEHLMSLEKLSAAGCPNLQWGSGVLEQLDKQLKGCIIK